MVSSPMFAPRLIPETIMSGISSSSPVTARCTQSVGVPLTKRKPLADSRTVSGRSSVRELEAPLWSRSGATTVIVPRSASVLARIASPGAKYPSSLLSRIRIYRTNLLINKEHFIRPRPDVRRPESGGFYSKAARPRPGRPGFAPGLLSCRQSLLGFTQTGPRCPSPQTELLGCCFRLLGEPHLPEEPRAEPFGIIVYSHLEIQRQGTALCARGLPVGDAVAEGHARGFPAHHSQFSYRTHKSPSLALFTLSRASAVPSVPAASQHAPAAFLPG